MLAFEVWVDDERICLAGIEDWAVLSTHLTLGRRAEPGSTDREAYIELSTGGLTEDDENGVSHHVRWKGRNLTVGAKVTINVVETDQPDEPTRRYRSDHVVQESPYTPEEWEEMERSDYLKLKAKFEPTNAN